MSVFQVEQQTSHLNRTMFFGEPVNVARYEKVRYPFFDKLLERQLGYFWRPQKADLTRDKPDFKALLPHEKHIFTSNLKRQILLDSVQGRAPISAFGPLASLPEIESWIIWWSAMEVIHSKSYTHIIRNVYNNPSEVFDGMLDIQEIVDCAKDVSEAYDRLNEFNANYQMTGVVSYEHKKAFWLAMCAANILEGIRFYVSFACSWAFAQQGRMIGNASIIKEIARDENLHLAGSQKILSILCEEDPDFERIRLETYDQVRGMFLSAINQEKEWAKYLFKDGSIIGLNFQFLCDYIDWLAAKRMKTVGYEPFTARGNNPMPWTESWIGGSDVQVAPQETEVESYVVSAIKQDVTESTFEGLEL
jgi:ribonucleoside-diphosphate reductase beta chain